MQSNCVSRSVCELDSIWYLPTWASGVQNELAHNYLNLPTTSSFRAINFVLCFVQFYVKKKKGWSGGLLPREKFKIRTIPWSNTAKKLYSIGNLCKLGNTGSKLNLPMWASGPGNELAHIKMNLFLAVGKCLFRTLNR